VKNDSLFDWFVRLSITVIGLLLSIIFQPSVVDTTLRIVAWRVLLPLIAFLITSLVVTRFRMPSSPEEGTTMMIENDSKAVIEAFLHSTREKVRLRIRVRQWIMLLNSAVQFVPDGAEWFATYLLPPESWTTFEALAKSYNETLRLRQKLSKCRCLILPRKRVQTQKLEELSVVKDSKAAGIEVRAACREEIKGMKPLGLKDFGMFGDMFVINAHKIPNIHKLNLDDTVIIEMLRGQDMDSYKSYRDIIREKSKKI